MTLEQVIAALIRALVSGLGGTTAPPPAGAGTAVRVYDMPDGLITMRAMRHQLVKIGGPPEVWGTGGSASDAQVVAEMAKNEGFCEEVRVA